MIRPDDIAATIRATWPPEVGADGRPLRRRRRRWRRQPRLGRTSDRSGVGRQHRDARRYRKGRKGAGATRPFSWSSAGRTRSTGRSAPLATARATKPWPRRTGRRYRRATPTRQLFRGLAPPRRAGGDLGRRRHRGGAPPSWRAPTGPKTTLFGRINDRPAGTAFIALQGRTAMLHALEVASSAGAARVSPASWCARAPPGQPDRAPRISRSSSPAQTTPRSGFTLPWD
jgi:hypothetical protein